MQSVRKTVGAESLSVFSWFRPEVSASLGACYSPHDTPGGSRPSCRDQEDPSVSLNDRVHWFALNVRVA